MSLCRNLRGRGMIDLVVRQMPGAKWQPDREAGAAAVLAFSLDRSAVKLHQFLHQRQSDAGPFEASPLRTFNAMEAFEQPWKLVGDYADAGVRDPDKRGASAFVIVDQHAY